MRYLVQNHCIQLWSTFPAYISITRSQQLCIYLKKKSKKSDEKNCKMFSNQEWCLVYVKQFIIHCILQFVKMPLSRFWCYISVKLSEVSLNGTITFQWFRSYSLGLPVAHQFAWHDEMTSFFCRELYVLLVVLMLLLAPSFKVISFTSINPPAKWNNLGVYFVTVWYRPFTRCAIFLVIAIVFLISMFEPI